MLKEKWREVETREAVAPAEEFQRGSQRGAREYIGVAHQIGLTTLDNVTMARGGGGGGVFRLH